MFRACAAEEKGGDVRRSIHEPINASRNHLRGSWEKAWQPCVHSSQALFPLSLRVRRQLPGEASPLVPSCKSRQRCVTLLGVCAPTLPLLPPPLVVIRAWAPHGEVSEGRFTRYDPNGVWCMLFTRIAFVSNGRRSRHATSSETSRLPRRSAATFCTSTKECSIL